MWDYVGIERTTRRLDHAADRITLLEREVAEYYGRFSNYEAVIGNAQPRSGSTLDGWSAPQA